MKNKTPLTITEGMKLYISGRVMRVQKIEGDVCHMLHENGCIPARDIDRFKDLGFLQNFGKPSDWRPDLKPLSELLMKI